MKKTLAIVLMVLCMLSIFAQGASETKTTTPTTTTEPAKTEAVVAKPTTAVYATASFGMKFSPFFAATAYDQDIVDMTQIGLLAADRGGAIIYDGINGETHTYNGTDYFYQGAGSVEVVQNADGTVDYKLTMRDDIYFSDGVNATMDDVIFGIYVLADPTYDGSSTLYAQPIIGISDYYNSEKYGYALFTEAGRDNTDFSLWTKAEQDQFWADLDSAATTFAQEIIDYVCSAYLSYAPSYIGATAEEVQASPELQVKLGMYLWGFDGKWFEGATAADYGRAILDQYNNVIGDAEAESAGSSLFDLLRAVSGDKYFELTTVNDVKSIAGIEKTGKYTMTVHMSEFDATSIYNMSFTIVPLHYYGDVSLYNGVDSFGFTKGDLSSVKAKTTQPLGAGPYVFESYNNGVVTLKANANYFLGKPVTDTLLFQESTDSDYVPGIVTGTFDIAQPSISDATLNAIKDANSNGELVGDTLTTYLVDYRGYGYIGINANLVSVGGNSGSEASKNLRKGIMTLLSVYRDTVINSYYGDRAAVIQYPISNTSWAAPQPTDVGYQIAYSKDVNGNAIYTSDMNDEQKYEAALQAAIGFFKAAGYTWDEASGKFTAAPEGAKLVYEALIPGDGQQDHPAYGIAVGASNALETIGITLTVNDCNSTTWTNALEANTAEIWAAAWQSTVDPDMYQVYHSRNANGKNTNSNHYQITDDELDALIIAGRKSSDTDFRKATYKTAMEIIMDWGVELPTYQRKDCTVTSTIRIDNDTMPKDMTPYWGWDAEIDKLATK